MKRIAGLVGVPVALLVTLAACSSTTEKGTVGVERSQFLLVSSAEMDKSAAAAYAQVIREQTPKGNVNKDPKQVERVRAIAGRIIPQTAVFRKDAPGRREEPVALDGHEAARADRARAGRSCRVHESALGRDRSRVEPPTRASKMTRSLT